MIGLEDRSVLAQDIEMAHRDGARLKPACAEAGITVRTLQRWKLGGGLTVGDRRPLAVRPRPAHALSAQEKETLLRVANESRFADMPPRESFRRSQTKGYIWPANRAFIGCCALMARINTEDGPKRRVRASHRPRIRPRRRGNCGVGT